MTPAQTAEQIGQIMAEHIEPLFKPECRLTFIMRTPGFPEREMVVTFDDLDEVEKVIERTKNRKPTQ